MTFGKILQIATAGAIVVAAGVSVFGGGAARSEKTVTILHTNDTHSQIFPVAADKGRWVRYR